MEKDYTPKLYPNYSVESEILHLLFVAAKASTGRHWFVCTDGVRILDVGFGKISEIKTKFSPSNCAIVNDVETRQLFPEFCQVRIPTPTKLEPKKEEIVESLTSLSQYKFTKIPTEDAWTLAQDSLLFFQTSTNRFIDCFGRSISAEELTTMTNVTYTSTRFICDNPGYKFPGKAMKLHPKIDPTGLWAAIVYSKNRVSRKTPIEEPKALMSLNETAYQGFTSGFKLSGMPEKSNFPSSPSSTSNSSDTYTQETFTVTKSVFYRISEIALQMHGCKMSPTYMQRAEAALVSDEYYITGSLYSPTGGRQRSSEDFESSEEESLFSWKDHPLYEKAGDKKSDGPSGSKGGNAGSVGSRVDSKSNVVPRRSGIVLLYNLLGNHGVSRLNMLSFIIKNKLQKDLDEACLKGWIIRDKNNVYFWNQKFNIEPQVDF